MFIFSIPSFTDVSNWDTLAFPSNIKNRVYCKFQIILNCFHHFHKHEGCGGNVSILCVLLCWRLPYYPTWKCIKWWWGTWQQSIWNWWFNAINWIWRNFAWWSWFRIRWNGISVRWHNHYEVSDNIQYDVDIEISSWNRLCWYWFLGQSRKTCQLWNSESNKHVQLFLN